MRASKSKPWADDGSCPPGQSVDRASSNLPVAAKVEAVRKAMSALPGLSFGLVVGLLSMLLHQAYVAAGVTALPSFSNLARKEREQLGDHVAKPLDVATIDELPALVNEAIGFP